MNEQLINDRIRLDNINSEMSRISNVAREYMNASQEQRDRVDPQLLASVLDRYNMLRADKLALEQSVVAREMEAQRQAQQQQTQQTYNGGGRRRIVIPEQEQTAVPNYDYSKDQSYYPGMSMRTDIPTQGTNTPIYRNWRNNLPNYGVTPYMPDGNVQTGYMTPVRTQTQTSNVPERPQGTTFGAIDRPRRTTTFGSYTPNYSGTFLDR